MKKGALHFARAVAVAASLVTVDVAAQAPANVSESDRQQMTKLLDGFLALYDPPRASPAKELEFYKRFFDTGPDFFMVVDAVFSSSWADREQRVMKRGAQATAGGDREGVHETLEQRVAPLGPDAAVLTRAFRYKFTDGSGKKGYQDGSITCAFARRGGAWKVVQYHGSHRPRVLEEAQPGDARR